MDRTKVEKAQELISIIDRLKNLSSIMDFSCDSITICGRANQERLGDIPQKVQESIKGGFSD